MKKGDGCIKIWTRFTLPEEYKYVLRKFEKEEDDPFVIWIAHVPKTMLKDSIFSEYVGEQTEANAWNWIESDNGRGFWAILGNNAGNFLEHPEGNGYFLVGSSV